MAQFKDLIVSGASRFIGKTYGSTFVGYLNGNADSATLATKDANGKTITEYISGLSINGNIITYTDGAGVAKTLTIHDTTYNQATSESLGLVKLYDETGSNEDGSMTQASVSEALAGKLATTATANKAVADSQGQNIDSTYIANASADGQQVTFTKGDGSTFNIFTQDHNTTYANFSTASAGLVPQSAVGKEDFALTGDGTFKDITQYKVNNAATADYAANASTAAFARTAETATNASTATNDAAGQKIDSTYIKNLDVSGRTVTVTKGDGTTSSFLTQDTNTEYALGTSESNGLTKLYATTGVNSDGSIVQSALTTILDNKLNKTATAAAANKDAAGQDIDSTYIKGASVNGRQVTFTRGDGSTFSLYTQDTNTEYQTGDPITSGLTKLYGYTGDNTDGTMTQNAITIALADKVDKGSAVEAATKDAMGQNIALTYLKNVSVDGRVVTITKGDNSTFSIQTQDNDTTYSVGTSATAGLGKLYSNTGVAEDGSITQATLTTLLAGKLPTTSTAVAAVADNIGQTIDETYIKGVNASGTKVTFTKGDGSTFAITTQDTNDNTTYSTGTSATEGLTKIFSTTGSATDGTMDQNSITTALNNKLNSTATASKATADADGQNISETYIKNASVSGKDITFTKGDNSTFHITTQDTTYSTGSSVTAGVTKLYDAVGTETDGTMTQAAIKSELDGKLSSAGTAAKATADSAGQNISNTYIKGIEVEGKKITVTKGDGSTFEKTTQDTTYGTGTSETAGLTKIYNTTGSNTDGTIDQNTITTALDGKLSTAGTAAKATADAAGQNISNTYIANASVDGQTVTFTKGNGATFSVTTQDTNTEYQTGTGEVAGLTKLYAGTGNNTDGTMTQSAITAQLNGKLGSSATAVAAVNDNANQQIDTTYIKNVSVSGRVVTFTKGNDSTFSITTQDNDTTYSDATSATAGLLKVFASTGSGTDGTMTQKAISDAIDGVYQDLNTKIGNINSFEVVICSDASDLPVTGEGHTIYFVPDDTGDQNKYVEYIWVEADECYEEIGSTAVDLSGYYTSTQTDTAISNATSASVTNISVNGTTVTVTRKDGSTFSFNTQDNNTTYTTATDTVDGLTKLYATTGTNTDGTLTQNAITSALNGKLATSATAAAAVNDSAGQDIHETYLKNASVSGTKVTFTKGDGSTFQITTQDTNDNTTYSTGTTAVEGLTKLYTSTGSNTDGTITQDAITSELSGKLSTAGTAARATADSTGQNISTTYLKNAEVEGKVVTFTKGDGSTFSVTTQDTNTTYSDATSATAGLSKLYSTTGTNTDGSIEQDALTTLLAGKLATTGVAAAATKDGSNQNIANTYIKDADVQGQVVTFTKGNGDTFSITTQDNNTTYGQGTSATAGLVKLFDTTGSSTQGTMDQNSITTALGGKLNSDATAVAANNDNLGNGITGYLRNASIDGKVVTFTKGDGSTFSITTQDTDTTYSTGTSATAGLTKLYATTGSEADGTMTQKSISDIVNGLETNKLATSATAAAAVNDGIGQEIKGTYVKNANLDQANNAITFTKGDGSTFNVVTPNTTYSTGTSATAGLTKIYTTTGTNTDGTMDQNSITAAMANSTVSSANNDGAGQNITQTYIKTASVNEQNITFTKGDGSTFTITTQDTNTTYSTGTSATAGLTKLYASSGSATDGTMTQAAIGEAIAGGSVAAATKDSAGQQIDSTYIKGVSVDGTTVTFTRGNNSTFTVQTQDNDTTYSIGSSTSNGLTRLYNTTGTNSNGAITQDAMTTLLEGKLATTATAGAATNDSAGQDIHTTYIKNASVNGQVVTFTKGDGSTFTITTQDTDTTYSDATSATAGIAKLYATTGTNTDGSITQAALTTALSNKINVGDTITQATSATSDSAGQNITNTYIRNAEANGTLVTFTKGDGSTFSITTQDSNTTYTTGTSESSGLTKLYGSIGNYVDGAMTQAAVTSALEGKLSTAGTAAAAVKDGANNTISETYIKGVSVSGRTVTFTKGDASTFSIDTQDSNTTYSTGTAEVSGLTKLYTSEGTYEDGTMTQKAIGAALEGKLSTAGTAAAAVKDGSNQNIANTYIKAANVDGRVVTFTRGDASTFSITTQDTNDNTTYSTGTSATAGLTKLYDGVGDNTDGTITQSGIKTALEGKLSTAGTAAGAVNDGSGNKITETYIKTASASGTAVTFTKGDGSTFSVTTQDTNTTYSTGTSATAGLTKLYSGIGSNEDGTVTQAGIQTALEGKLSTAGTAAAATKDGSNQNIAATYIKGASVSGQTVTFTKGDGSTFDITTQDNNTTYDVGTTGSAGLTKLYSGIGENTDGTMTQAAINTALNAKLSTAGTAAAAVKDNKNQTIDETYLKAASSNGAVVTFTKGDGSTFSINTQDENTTYSTGTTAVAGLTKLYTGIGENEDGTMTQAAINTALNGKLSTAGTAAAATKDGSNNNIAETYIKNAQVSGQTVTFTKGDSSTFSITTQDSNTTYTTGTSESSGLTKLYATTGSNTDGTMTQSAINTALNGKLSTAGTAAAAVKDNKNQTIDETYIKNASVSGQTVTFTKGDGSTFTVGTQDTTYGTGTSAAAGLTKLYATTGVNSDGAINQNALTTILAGKLDTDGTATAATKDGSNQNIAETYIKAVNTNGTTVTFTRGDNSTFSVQTQDTNDQYGTGTTATAGLTKLYATTGVNSDGAINQNALTTILAGKLDTDGTVAAATKDGSNQNIAATYIKALSVSGQTVTITKGDGTTSTITTQDTVAQNATSTTAGLVKIYDNTTGSNTDGAPTQYAVNAALNNKLNTTATATAAEKDNAGQTIDSTYIKAASASGTSITFTRGNGSTFTVTTEDNVVAQNYTTVSENKPLLMGYNASTQSTINTIYQAQDKIYANPNSGAIYASSFVGVASSATNASTAAFANATSQCSKLVGTTTTNSLEGDLLLDFGYEAEDPEIWPSDIETADSSSTYASPTIGMFVRNGSGGMTKRTITNNATFSGASTADASTATYYSGVEYTEVPDAYRYASTVSS